ncbi:unnamed protein product [Gulo gulo]|nr:unnamed protein product [Gulo gulo]
MTPRVSC